MAQPPLQGCLIYIVPFIFELDTTTSVNVYAQLYRQRSEPNHLNCDDHLPPRQLLQLSLQASLTHMYPTTISVIAVRKVTV